jgi:hypothetical protein
MCSAMMFWTELSYWRKAPKAGHHHFKHSQCGCPLQYIYISTDHGSFPFDVCIFSFLFPPKYVHGLDCIYIYKYTTVGDYPIRSSNWLPFESTYVHPRIWWGSWEHICSPPYLMGFMLMNLYGFLYCVMLGIFILFVFVSYAQCCQNL